MNKKGSSKSLQDFIFISKYSKQDGVHKETYEEAVTRVMNTHRGYLTSNFDIKNTEEFDKYFNEAYEAYYNKQILGAQRSLQFGGEPMLKHQMRLYNCSSSYVDRVDFFKELFYILLCGAGAGYSVQSIHTKHLPKVKGNSSINGIYKIEDSIEGWALSTHEIIKSYFYGTELPLMDYSEIREKGAFISGGFKAPGHEPLKKCHEKIKSLLDSAKGRRLSNFECHLLSCIIADAVISGGVRRSALIVLFDADDKEMLSCKTGDWFNRNPELARANNSVVILPDTKKEVYDELFEFTQQYGEPGIAFLKSPYHAYNPCFSGDSKLLTTDGYKRFDELEKLESFDIINAYGKTVKSKVWVSGVKNTVYINGVKQRKVINCTPDHVFMTVNGDEVEAENLKGRRIKVPFINESNFNLEFTRYGFIQGDGGLGRLSSKSHKGVEVILGKDDRDVKTLFGVDPDNDKKVYYINDNYGELKENLISLGFDSSKLPERKFPSTYDDWTELEQRSFLRGLYSANGCVIKGKRVSFKTTSVSLLDKLIKSLSEFDIKSYFTTNKSKNVSFSNGDYNCRESYDVNISNIFSLANFYRLIGFVHQYKMDKLNELEGNGFYVKSISKGWTQTVYDFEDPEDHWGIVNGLQAHNCFEVGMIPSLEIGNPLKSGWSLCNLTEQNGSLITNKEEFLASAKASAILGTFQSAYTTFPFLGEVSEAIIRRDALLGVGITGMCNNPEILFNDELQKEAAELVVSTNKVVADLLGINHSARTTVIKPAGNSSQMLGTLSGIHAGHSSRYIRNVQVNKEEQAGKIFKSINPDSVEDSVWSSSGSDDIISFPVQLSDNSILKEDLSALEFLDKVKLTQNSWIKYGTNLDHEVYKSGFAEGLTHNVSNTITVNGSEWDKVKEYLWENREFFCGVSMLSSSGDLDYPQAPFVEVEDEISLAERFGVASVLASGLVVDGLHSFDNNLFQACDTAIAHLTGDMKMYSTPLDITPDVISNYIKNKIEEDEEGNLIFKSEIDGVMVTDTNAIIASLYAKRDAKLDWIRRFKKFSKNYLSGNYEKASECLKKVSALHKWETISRAKTVDWSPIEWEEDYIDVETISAQGCYGGKCEV